VLIALAFGAAAASAQPGAVADAPWMAEVKFGYLQPEIEDYERFYGSDDSRLFALAFGYRFKPWIEIDAETQYTSDKGAGRLPSSGAPGAPVDYTLVPAHVFVKMRAELRADQLFVPYVGIGVARAYYKQEIELQPDRDGTTDTGTSLRIGLEISMNRLAQSTPGDTDPLKRTYLFIEAQRFEAKVDDIDLGGDTLLIGFRFELGSR
jgi:opacity protein-like surface antigen